MFLKNLKIENDSLEIRNISFYKGINLIVDETETRNKKESGNNVGKTTVLRLIDYCLGSSGKNIYKDPEFREKSNTEIEDFLKNNNIVISLTLKKNLEDASSEEIVIRRNFLSHSKKIQEINGASYNNREFPLKLKQEILHSSQNKPTFRQIISRNIRDDKDKLQKTIKTLPYATQADYEALYLFWLGIGIDKSDRKQKLIAQEKTEEELQKRLHKDSNLSQINQSLHVINRDIKEISLKKDSLNLNDRYEEELSELNKTKSDINTLSSELGILELRKELINESESDLKEDLSNIDCQQIESLYKEARILIPNIQKSFEDTLSFHNQMISEKVKYVTEELPELEAKIVVSRRKLSNLLTKEKNLTEKLRKTGAVDELQNIISELSDVHEKKGKLEEQKRLWDVSKNSLALITSELEKINAEINAKDDLIQERIASFNDFFSKISYKLYGEQFVLSSDKNGNGYELNIGSIGGNLGTGKKKGQIAAFDLSYIQFADCLKIDCLHFILHDQIENIHGNQISNLLTEVINELDCQYVLPVLRDKLPDNIDVKQYEILSLSQSEKLFKV